MNIKTTQMRHVEYTLRQNQSVSCDNHSIGFDAMNTLLHNGILERQRLEHFNSTSQRQFFYRRWMHGHATPSRARP